MEEANYEVLPVSTEGTEVRQVDVIERANVDTQVATAKQYPRDIKRAINNSIAMATMDVQTAQSMGYALPRGDKPITGPSVHLAKLVVSNWGNIRSEAKVVGINDKQVISRGTCWDLESNVAASFEVRRSIVNKYGKKFTDDMITVTGNAANAIAFRNAVFSVIPKAVVDKVYQAAQQCVTGDLSDENKMIARRKNCIDYFNDNFGITEKEVCMLCGKEKTEQIKANEIALLLGIAQSLNDGDTSVAELMKPYRKEENKANMQKLASDAAAKSTSKEEAKK